MQHRYYSQAQKSKSRYHLAMNETIEAQHNLTTVPKSFQAMHAYWQLLGQLYLQSLDLWQTNLDNAAQKTPESAYQLWVDCYESVYQQSLATEKHLDTYAGFINGLLDIQTAKD
jgi:hypothetical protein